MIHSRLMVFVLAAAVISGCSLIPQYDRPTAPVPEQFPQTPATPKRSAELAPEAGWRGVFIDPALRQLIELALHNNRDLRVAVLNVDAYRAQYRIQRADLFPAISIGASGTRQRLPADMSSSGEAAVSSSYGVDLGISAYELDLFGRVRSLSVGAFETYMASVEAQRAAEVSLTASVANAYLTWVADREQLKLTRETLKTYEESLRLTTRSTTVGIASALDQSRARTSVESARASLASYQRLVAQDENALTTLLGTSIPADLPAPAPLAEIAIAELPVGVASDLLNSRPDILQAEHRLRAANANIGAARAAFFPSISLTTSAGTASSELDGLFKAGSGAWSFSPNINLPIFNAGALRASLDYSTIQKDVNVATYEKAIQTAFQEVSDGLAARSTYTDQLKAQLDLVEANQIYYDLADSRYRTGIDSSLTLLDAQRSLFSAQQTLISDRLAQRIAEINLYVALGGSWKASGH